MHKFLWQFNMKVSGGGAAAYLDFIMQKIPFPPAVLAPYAVRHWRVVSLLWVTGL